MAVLDALILSINIPVTGTPVEVPDPFNTVGMVTVAVTEPSTSLIPLV